VRQQINLYQPILREPPKLFGGLTAVCTLAAVLVALLLLSAFATFKVKRLEETTQALREQEGQQEEDLSTASTMSAARSTPADLAARVKRIEAEVASHTRALALLRAGAAGRTTGFAERLEALARRHVDGVWIDRMALSGMTEAMSLGGATFDPDLVTRYLQNLSQETALAGARFDELAIERPRDKTPAQLRFRASSLHLPERTVAVASSQEGGPTEPSAAEADSEGDAT
jgi:Tfp pilus assembly protein PilN